MSATKSKQDDLGKGGLIIDRPLTMPRQRNAVKTTNSLNGVICAYQEDDLITDVEYRALMAALTFIESILSPAYVITNTELSAEVLKAHMKRFTLEAEELDDDYPF